MERLVDPKIFRLELNKLDCIDKFGYVILPITKLNAALERSIVEAVPVVYSEWTRVDYEPCGHDYICSECGFKSAGAWNFCSKCRANMMKYNGDCKKEIKK